MNYLFVYGLLKSDYDNEAAKTIRSHCTLIGEGYTYGRMFDLGSYPGIVYEKTSNLKVFGEVYRIDRNAHELIAFLDAFEECGPEFDEPNEYRKEIIPVNVNNIEYNASTYIYNRNLTGLRMIATGKYNNKQGHR
jgi:gamma-glutamylcyclotransferase (GGCT)/AIG2-like uncharacterized protein YtfP